MSITQHFSKVLSATRTVNLIRICFHIFEAVLVQISISSQRRFFGFFRGFGENYCFDLQDDSVRSIQHLLEPIQSHWRRKQYIPPNLRKKQSTWKSPTNRTTTVLALRSTHNSRSLYQETATLRAVATHIKTTHVSVTLFQHVIKVWPYLSRF